MWAAVAARCVHEHPVDEVVDAGGLLASDEQLGLPRAVRRDRVDVDVAAVLDPEGDAVALPDRLAGEREGGALPVEGGREDAAVAPVGLHHRDLAVVRIRAVLGGVDVGDARAVGGERAQGGGLVGLGQSPRLGSLGIHLELVERLLKVDVPAVAAHRGEDEARAVGSPRRRVVLAVAVGELPLVVAVEADDEDVFAAVAGPADAVELEEDAGEPSRRTAAVVLLLVRLVGHPAREGDSLRVRRPRDRVDGLLAVGQLPRLAALLRHPGESRDPLTGDLDVEEWIPAFAGMTYYEGKAKQNLNAGPRCCSATRFGLE